MTTIEDLEFLVQASQAVSLSAAAREAGISPAAASARVKRLEQALGLVLFVRSTRSLRLTPEGEAFVERCVQGLGLIRGAQEELSARRRVVRGRVQVSLPSDLGRNVVLPWLHAFRKRYPEIELKLQFSDRVAGLFEEPIDLALRYGEPSDTGLVALPLAPANRRVLCASPAYLQAHGRPAAPAELAAHPCLTFRLADRRHDRWRFWHDGAETVVRVSGHVQCDDGDAVHRLALLGAGIAYKSRLDVAADLAAGRLLALCEAWQTEPAPLYLVCADRRQLRPPVERLRRFMAEQVAALT